MDFAFCEDIFLGFKGFARAGLYMPPHIHPQANQWFYGIDWLVDECEGAYIIHKPINGFTALKVKRNYLTVQKSKLKEFLAFYLNALLKPAT